MTVLKPSIGTSAFDSTGERHLGEPCAITGSGDYHHGVDAIQVMTMKVSKGLEFPVVALPGVGHMPAPGEDEKEAALVFYVAATRATPRLVMGVGGDGGFGQPLGT